MSKQKLYYTYVLEIEGTAEIFYVGKGTGKRCKSHKANAYNEKKQHYPLYRKIRQLLENGSDFRYRIIFTSPNEQEAYDKEKELIALIGRENLTNLTDGGDGSSCKGHTEETKKKIGDKNRGRKHTPETLQKMKEVHTGFRFSEEQRQGLKDKVWENSERLAHLREQAEKGKRRVRRLDTGEEFDSKKDAM